MVEVPKTELIVADDSSGERRASVKTETTRVVMFPESKRQE